ncbi:hypothetical protein AURDEDRAFT_161619 [Auricularia subglabra TFB-10046 SS5]|nr:hypothetical protein AURDEDRAFT_161619 [Auricularia subglabra TFB-10046 SS5]
MHSPFTLFTLATAAAALPNIQYSLYNDHEYSLYNDGTRGTVSGKAVDFGATYHASATMSRQGCSSTAEIKYCYAAHLSSDRSKMLETTDDEPYLAGGVGDHQRAVLLSQPHAHSKGVITHRLRFHVSSGFKNVSAGAENAVTFIGLRNRDPKAGIKALDIRARNFTGEGTSGSFLYVAAVNQDDSEATTTLFPLKDAVGNTIEVSYKLGVNGATVDTSKTLVAQVTAHFVESGAQIFTVGVPKKLYPHGVVDPRAHRLLFGGSRQVSSDMSDLKVWFGDYIVDDDNEDEDEDIHF